ncbi:hypothetical protein RUM43_002901 [Polyplax serrata]|uniref:DNA damage-binding protein 2 n=1 Tax=Polyplax serrata TaxID=468196 RepID=A0AAN8NUC5_POLSC
MEAPFDRRVTCILWHPTNARLLAVASHGGDILLYSYENDISTICLMKGCGAGGSIQSMKFDPQNSTQLYTASMEGKFLVMNFETKEQKEFLNTNDYNRWFISLDVNPVNNLMVVGDTKGGLTILTLDGHVVDTVQLHKKGFKISHAEFSKRETWLLSTSSTDGTLKLWDIRHLKPDKNGKIRSLHVINHEKPLNAAYFSLTDGCRLLTTDQKDKIMIYRAPLWNLETTIHHPHRQFQHLTPIRAHWHPNEDIVFVGRYPCKTFPGYHENELRTIDFFDGLTGKLLYQHCQKDVNGIMSLNRFNSNGDALASSYGARFLIWKPDFRNLDATEQRRSKKRKSSEESQYSENADFRNNNQSDANWSIVIKDKVKNKRQEKKKKV